MPYTRCPTCATGFRISASHISAAGGQVRCGRCGVRFDALEALSDDPSGLPPHPPSQKRRPDPPAEQQPPSRLELRPSEEPEPATPEQDDEPEQPAEQQPPGPLELRPDEEPKSATREQDEEPEQPAEQQSPDPLEIRPSEEPEPATPEQDEEPEQPAEQQSPGPLELRPSEEPEPATREQDSEPEQPGLREAGVALSPLPEELADFAAAYTDYETQPGDTRRRLLAGTAKGLGILALVLILLLQLAWFERDQLVYSPDGRSLLSALCRVAGCEPPPRRDLREFGILSRGILPRPEDPRTLNLRLVFVNQASFPQPYPRIQVSLLSPQGQPTNRRTFTPLEYLTRGTNPGSLLQPQEPVPVSLDLVNPHTGWAGYRFDFL